MPNNDWMKEFDKDFRAYVNAGIAYAEVQETYQALDFEDEVKWLKSYIGSLLTLARREERELLHTAIKKIWDKHQNNLHGGYDDADALMQREIALNDVLRLFSPTSINSDVDSN